MSFISYAQNFEDVMLWRALGHIENGFYIDIGAQHPINDSVSKGFYEHGWRGIHVEPVPEFADLLREDRPDEIVLQLALSDKEGVLELNVIAETGLSTAVDAYAERHKSERGFEPKKVHVPVLTIRSAFGDCIGKDVHWLKIDVEGLEENVLRGWDSERLRPWVMVVEATVPNSTELSYADWEQILLDARYRFVYFDGLNRFYVAEEHVELVKSFSSPPNVFDRFQLSGLSSSPLTLFVQTKYESQLETKNAELLAGIEERHAINAQIQKLEAHQRELDQTFLAQRTSLMHELAASEQWLQDKQIEFEEKQAEFSMAEERLCAVNVQIEILEVQQLELNQAFFAHQRLLTQTLNIAEQRLQEKQAEINQSLERSQWLENEWNASRIEVQNLGFSLRTRSEELQKVLASTSWRLTAPLRKIALLGKRVPSLPGRVAGVTKRTVMPLIRPVTLLAIKKVLANPAATKKTLALLNKTPGLKQKLRRSAVYAGVIKEHRAAAYNGQLAELPRSEEENGAAPIHHKQELSASANRILSDLQKITKASAR